MSTVVNFQGKRCIEPGSYAAIGYNPTSVVNVAEFGNCMIIDTGLSLSTVNGVDTEFAGGSGVKGELFQGLKSVYEFDNYEDFLSFMGGGLVSDIAEKIFTPRDGVVGAPKLYYARAATTTSAKITIDLSSVPTSEAPTPRNCKHNFLSPLLSFGRPQAPDLEMAHTFRRSDERGTRFYGKDGTWRL